MKKTTLLLIIIIAGLAVIAIFRLVASPSDKSTNLNNNLSINNKAQSNSPVNAQANTNTITEDSAVIIADVEAAINAELTGTNNNGQPYKQWVWVDQRIGDDLYLAVIRYNADTYGIEGDYQTKMQRERNEIIAKAASVSKAIMSFGYPMGIISFEAYTGNTNPEYQVSMEKQQLDSINWNQDISSLVSALPSVWTVQIDNYAIYLTNS